MQRMESGLGTVVLSKAELRAQASPHLRHIHRSRSHSARRYHRAGEVCQPGREHFLHSRDGRSHQRRGHCFRGRVRASASTSASAGTSTSGLALAVGWRGKRRRTPCCRMRGASRGVRRVGNQTQAAQEAQRV